MDEILRQGLSEFALTPPTGALEQLQAYYKLLDERGRVMNLTAITGPTDTARLHFLDCAALLRYVDPGDKSLVDVGSGAGFPGLVLRILSPRIRLTLLDSQHKRVAFQREVCEKLGLSDVRCLQGRAEEAAELRESFDFSVSRALARVNLLCELCLPLTRVGGTCIAMKGPEPEEELREADNAIRTLGAGPPQVEKYRIPGTDTVHSAVLLRKISPTPPGYPRRFPQMQKRPL